MPYLLILRVAQLSMSKSLIEALQNEVIFAAGLDVYEKEPLQESALLICRTLSLCLT